jgi:hypothetical protein
MNDTTARDPGVSSGKRRSKRGGNGCVFLFCFFFMIIGAMPALLGLPGLLARFNGMKTTALITSDASCSWTDSNDNTTTGYYYIYTFTVSSGKVYKITNTTCNSGPDTIGANETLWYEPANPTLFITENAWTFDWIFFLGFSIPMLLFAFAYFRWLFRRLFAPTAG